MKSVSIKELKAVLSAAVADAEAGRTIVVTRHGKPVAQFGPVRAASVHAGERAGLARIEPALKRGPVPDRAARRPRVQVNAAPA
jgi:antitoxin (DNA-binding transcriptional repressor) of toxin-antitoxin stability system